MKDIDWSKAPEGTTHWEPESGLINASWMKLSDSQWYYWPPRSDAPAWAFTLMRRPERVDRMVARPTTPHWNGTGLPPVGVNVTLDAGEHGVFDDYQVMIGTPVKVTAAFKSPIGVDMIACALPGGLCGCFRADMARPIRTPEQIAAEEREVAIHAMLELFETNACKQVYDMRGGVAAIYDAGYRLTAEDER